MFIIGFAFKARSGKDTAISAILNKYADKYNIEKHCFADSLKREVCGQEKELCEKYNIPYDSNPPMDDPLCNSIHGKQRALLQWYGTEFRRAQDNNYWVNQLDNYLKNKNNDKLIVLCSDVRYKNECQWIKNNNGIVINVKRGNFVSELTEEQKNHISENDLNDYNGFDCELINDSSIEYFNEKSCIMFDSIINKYNLYEYCK